MFQWLLVNQSYCYASSLDYVTPALPNGWAGPKEADGLEEDMLPSMQVKNRLDNELLPWHDIDCINNKPCKHILPNSAEF